jgi:hypothetical protein
MPYASLFSQTDKIYPFPCTDSIRVEGVFTEYAEYYFFGGRLKMEKFLDINLFSLLKETKGYNGECTILIEIDSNGYQKGMYFVSEMPLCEKCNSLILEKVSMIKRWIPSCYYDIKENKIICENRQIVLIVKIKNSNIYINGRRESLPLIRGR